MNATQLTEKIRDLADATGIDALGFAAATEFTDYALQDSKRRNPKLSLASAKSIIVAGVYIGGVTLPKWIDPWYGRTSRLYLSEFFLDVVKPLEPLVDFLRAEGYQAIACDGSQEGGSILPLKLAAVRAGLGWQGKHSLIISKKFGTFLALGGIITNAELTYSLHEEPNRCHKCDKCQQACPVAALDQAHVLDVGKCMSNLLMSEHLPQTVREAMENRVGDCEICQDACPWNQKHIRNPLSTRLTKSFQEKVEAWEDFFYLPNLARLSEERYQEVFGRLNTDIPYPIFRRNVLIALERAEKGR